MMPTIVNARAKVVVRPWKKLKNEAVIPRPLYEYAAFATSVLAACMSPIVPFHPNRNYLFRMNLNYIILPPNANAEVRPFPRYPREQLKQFPNRGRVNSYVSTVPDNFLAILVRTLFNFPEPPGNDFEIGRASCRERV